MPVTLFLRAQQSPELSDISTDTANPPPLVATAVASGSRPTTSSSPAAKICTSVDRADPVGAITVPLTLNTFCGRT